MGGRDKLAVLVDLRLVEFCVNRTKQQTDSEGPGGDKIWPLTFSMGGLVTCQGEARMHKAQKEEDRDSI
jgi:hypothetical protein